MAKLTATKILMMCEEAIDTGKVPDILKEHGVTIAHLESTGRKSAKIDLEAHKQHQKNDEDTSKDCPVCNPDKVTKIRMARGYYGEEYKKLYKGEGKAKKRKKPLKQKKEPKPEKPKKPEITKNPKRAEEPTPVETEPKKPEVEESKKINKKTEVSKPKPKSIFEWE